MEVKYPHITVQLTSVDSNVFNLIGVVKEALRKAGVSATEISAFTKEALNKGDYDKVIVFLTQTVVVE